MIKGIRYYSLLGSSGYGDAALAYMKGLLTVGVPLQWSPLVYTKWGVAPRHLFPEKHRPSIGDLETGIEKREELLNCLECEIDYDTVIIHSMPELWPKLSESGKVNIGYSVWETDQLPSHWPELIRSVDHVCVPCEFNRQLFTLPGGPGVSVVPHAIRNTVGLANSHEAKAYKRSLGMPDDMYVFYMIGACDPRKAMQETLLVFLQEFRAEENVCLIIKTDREGSVNLSGEIKKIRDVVDELMLEYPTSARLVLVADRIPETEIDLIHAIGDCFFSLTHSEGWGLCAFDAAATGNPVIITGWGGQLDYLPACSSYHVNYQLMHVKNEIGWESYETSQCWAYADIEDARRQLRYVFDNREEAKIKGQQLKKHSRKHFSDKRVIADWLRAINDAHPQ